jgi:hypothetical protein
MVKRQNLSRKIWTKLLGNDNIFLALNVWPHRLGVRTPGFHPGNRGSNPRGATKFNNVDSIFPALSDERHRLKCYLRKRF